MHYRGELITDTFTIFPNRKPFSEKEYNTKFVLDDVVLSVDTCITKDSLTFVRLFFDFNSAHLPELNAVGDFFFTASVEQEINLIFYKNTIYKIEPSFYSNVMRAETHYDFIGEVNAKTKLDSILKRDYDSIYTHRYFGNYNMLKKILDGSVITNQGVVNMPTSLLQNQEHIEPLLKVDTPVPCQITQHTLGQFICWMKDDELPGLYGGRVKIFRDSPEENRCATYFYSSKYFLPKITCEIKWEYTYRAGHGGNPPYKERPSPLTNIHCHFTKLMNDLFLYSLPPT